MGLRVGESKNKASSITTSSLIDGKSSPLAPDFMYQCHTRHVFLLSSGAGARAFGCQPSTLPSISHLLSYNLINAILRLLRWTCGIHSRLPRLKPCPPFFMEILSLAEVECSVLYDVNDAARVGILIEA